MTFFSTYLMDNAITIAKNLLHLSFELDRKMYILMRMTQCYWCASIATKIVQLGLREKNLCCDKCAKNIDNYKERFCSQVHDKLCYPLIWQLNKKTKVDENQYDVFYLYDPRFYNYDVRNNFFINLQQSISEQYQMFTCNICKKYLRKIRKGCETDFFKIDFFENT